MKDRKFNPLYWVSVYGHEIYSGSNINHNSLLLRTVCTLYTFTFEIHFQAYFEHKSRHLFKQIRHKQWHFFIETTNTVPRIWKTFWGSSDAKPRSFIVEYYLSLVSHIWDIFSGGSETNVESLLWNTYPENMHIWETFSTSLNKNTAT